MKAALLSGIRRFECKQIPSPQLLTDSDVLIRIRAVGVCGSDIHYYNEGRIGSQVVSFPFIIGHEASGTVEGVGDKVRGLSLGQNVAIDPSVSCGHCDQCLAGREHTCRSLLFLGCPGQLEGSLCEEIIVPGKCCYPIPPGMTFEQGALTEPLSIALYAVERSPIAPRAKIGILGVGPIGMSIFHVLRAEADADVYVTDKIDDRLQVARKLNPVWAGNPGVIDIVSEVSRKEPLLLDVVYECSGDPAAISQGVRLLKPGGTLMIVGIPEVDEISLPIHELRRKEITIVNVRRQVHCTQKAVDFIASRRVQMDDMVTHRFPLEEVGAAFDLVANYRQRVMKAMIIL